MVGCRRPRSIAGVLHEYSALDGVQEDVVHIMLNLKGVVFKLHNRDEVTLVLRRARARSGRATSRPHDVEIVNPSTSSRTWSSGGKLDMQIKVEGPRLRARHDAPLRRRADQVDRPHRPRRVVSPVARVSYTVENARVEQRTDLDKAGDGDRHQRRHQPEEAIRASAKILVEQLAVFAQIDVSEAGGFDQPAQPPARSTRSCCARSTSSSSPCARPTA